MPAKKKKRIIRSHPKTVSVKRKAAKKAARVVTGTRKRSASTRKR